LVSVGITKYLHKKKYRLKVTIPVVFSLWAIISIIIYPRVDYEILQHPRIPIETKIKMVAEDKFEQLGHNTKDFNESIFNKDGRWIVEFIPKNNNIVKDTIRIIINEELEFVAIE
jgi:hypothetical protein